MKVADGLSIQKPIKCALCETRFTSTRNIPRHMKLQHSVNDAKRFQCFHCKRVYTSKGNHDAHFDKRHLPEFLLYVKPEEIDMKGTSINNQSF